MTARQVFESTLIELSKIQAPSLKLYEFNYLFNKAINQYINKVYNTYDVNQQTTDDLRVLKSTAFITPHKIMTHPVISTDDNKTTRTTTYSDDELSDNVGKSNSAIHNSIRTASSYLSRAHSSIQSLRGANYEVYLPIDYLHMLNCVCVYYVAKQKDCYDAGSYIEIPATRLTADSWSQIITDIYNRPSPMKPYYYIHNENISNIVPTNPYSASANTDISAETQLGTGTDMDGIYHVTSMEGGETLSDTQSTSSYPAADDSEQKSNFQRTFKLGESDDAPQVSLVEKPTAVRFGNTSNVRCEIRYGKDDSLFQLVEVQVDYVKCPQYIRLTQEQIDLTEDTSQIMEFPDYVNQEIINELVHLVMERTNDPRLANNIQMTQTIARQAGQQAAAPQAAQQ